jgi:hypothetical protein
VLRALHIRLIRGLAAWYLESFGPRWGAAVISPAKFSEYSMNPDHPSNGGKHLAFDALGWNVGDPLARETAAAEVIAQLRAGLPRPKLGVGDDEYGQRYRTEVVMVGPNGGQGSLVAIWQVDAGTVTPRLITNWLEVHV